MKLTELDPHWVNIPHAATGVIIYLGISFLCPCSKCTQAACPHCGRSDARKRLAVMFWPPIDVSGHFAALGITYPHAKAHSRTGGTFDTITITPSIGFDNIGHWHGNIIDGQIC